MSTFASLRQPSYAWLWTGQTVSRLGDSLYSVALAWWVLQETGSAAVMGTVLVFTFVPLLIFLLVGGVAVDRFKRLHVMLFSDLLSGSVVAIVAALAFADRLEVWHVLVASAVFGFVSAFFEPAYVATVPEVVPDELLSSANALTSLSGQIVRIGGPALGAAIIGVGGTSIAFALNALSFFISALCLLPLIGLHLQTDRAASSSMLADMREGFATIMHSPWLWVTIAIASLSNITHSGPLAVALPFLVAARFGENVGALGLLQSMVAFGAVAGALLLGRWGKLRRRGLIAYGGLIGGGLAVAAYGLPIGIAGVALAAVINGVSMTCFGLIWTHTLQELVPRDRLGRVASVDMLGSFALLPVGYAVTGWVTDRIGAAPVFVAGGLLTVVLVSTGLLHPAIRNLD
jgi:MFS family permease